MDIESICSTSGKDSLTTIESVLPSDVFTKLRRLKIQESIITTSLGKNYCDEDDQKGVDFSYNPNWKICSEKIRNNINEIKNMLEDIRIATSDSEDNIKNINIEEIKKDILNLNANIKSLEDFVSTELKSLKSEEKELIRQMNEEPKTEVVTKGRIKIQTNQYNEVVPSPVRVLINSPLKCPQVQKFQEFMSKSKNRYGGWNEYNHNIFVQLWNTFYATDDIETIKNNMKEISRNNLLPQFKDEIYEKISGIQFDDIILHSKWFSEYCYLKKAQQTALDKWRDNKRKIKGRHGKVKSNNNILQNLNKGKLCKKQNETDNNRNTKSIELFESNEFEQNQNFFKISNKTSDSPLQMNEELFDVFRSQATNMTIVNKLTIRKSKPSTFATPTEQWNNRCNRNGARETPRIFSNIESIEKLCIPNWRLSLHK